MIIAPVPHRLYHKCQLLRLFMITTITMIVVFLLTSNMLIDKEPFGNRVTEYSNSSCGFRLNVLTQSNSIPVNLERKPLFSVLEPAEIQYRIDRYNKLQTVLNEDIYGSMKNDSLVIVVMVHNRLMYLRHTVASLAKARDIENALLIFSHDYYDEEINYFIQKLNFCKIMQIFYPFSIQTHPNQFPGESPNDCPSQIKKSEAIKKKCNNALYPDSYGYYRNAALVQTKHHWWWKMNHVFDQLNVTKNFEGLFVFIEEDHYVLPDFIHMLNLMNHFRQLQCPQCSIFSLGIPSEDTNYSKDSFGKVQITQWISNLGLAFNRSVWNELKRCSKTFCTYDDYNWDWTLQVVSAKCFSPRATTMVLSTPRALHFGECGMHHLNNCSNSKGLRKIKKLILSSSTYQYPTQLSIQPSHILDFANFIVKNGNWGDIRDHNLCLNMTR